MASYHYRTPCPECGSTKVRVISTGADEQDRMLRLRRCQECNYKFTTIEVISPVSFYRLDVVRKWRNRMRMRELRGYHGGLGGNPGTAAPSVTVTFRVNDRTEAA